MRPGDRAELKHTDTLCFGMAPKTRSHVNKVRDLPEFRFPASNRVPNVACSLFLAD